MRKPKDSLDEFAVQAAEKAAQPPRMVELQFVGEVEVLKPLVRPEIPEHSDPSAGNPFRRNAPNRLSWLQSAAAAAAVLGIMVVILLSAIFIGITEPARSSGVGTIETAESRDTATLETYEDELTSIPEPFRPGIFGTPELPIDIRPSSPKAKLVPARRVRRAALRLRRQPLLPRVVISAFIPTTLIIYPENGEIKSRIEPQVAALYKKPQTLSN